MNNFFLRSAIPHLYDILEPVKELSPVIITHGILAFLNYITAAFVSGLSLFSNISNPSNYILLSMAILSWDSYSLLTSLCPMASTLRP